MEKYIAIDEDTNVKTTLNFKRANPKRDYVRILQVCDSVEPKTLREIYPGVSSPMAAEVQEQDNITLRRLPTNKHRMSQEEIRRSAKVHQDRRKKQPPFTLHHRRHSISYR